MAQTGYTPILIYGSTTASSVPLAANLTTSASGVELAINAADGKLYFKNSSGVVTLLAGAGGAGIVAGSNTQLQFNNSGVFGASANLTWDGSKVTASAYQTGGNLTFTGTGNRITGDFSNATVASRVMFQTSTVNGTTVVGAMPNGTSGVAQFAAFSSAGLTDYSSAVIQVSAATGSVNIISGQAGAGSYFPILFFTSGTEKLRIAADATGTYTFGGTAPRITGDFSNATIASRVAFQTSTTNGNTAIPILPNGTSTNAQLQIYNNSDPTNGSFLQLASLVSSVNIYSSIQGTGTYLPMTFYTGGSERMRLDTSGNVGVGTSSPTQTAANRTVLSVNGTTTAIVNLNAGGVNKSYFYFDGTNTNLNTTTGNLTLQNDSANSVTFNTNGANERMRIDSSGNVGIGTNSPLGKLKVGVGNNAPAASGNMNTGVIFEASNAARAINIGVNNTAGYSWINAAFANNSGIADNLVLMTGATERMRIDSSGNVGIGTSSPTYRLSVAGANNTGIASFSGNNNGVLPGSDGDGTLVIGGNYAAGSAEVDYFHNNSTYKGTIGGHRFLQRTGASTSRDLMWLTENLATFYTGGSERMRIDSSGNVLVATNTLRTNYSSGAQTPVFQIEKAADVRASITRDSNDSSGAVIYFGKTRGTTVNSNTVVADGDNLGLLAFEGADGTNLIRAASVSAQVDGVPGANDMPGRLLFSTTADGGTTAVERMRINSSGDVLVTNPAGLGYGTGSGGTVTQATSKSTAVTLNKPTGKITMNAAAMAAGGVVEFVFNNSLATNNDLIMLTLANQTGAYGNYNLWGGTFSGGGGFYINVKNISGGSLSEALVINFAIIKGATA